MSYLKKKFFLTVFLQFFLFQSVIVQGATISAQTAVDHLDQKNLCPTGKAIQVAKKQVVTEPRVTTSSGNSRPTVKKSARKDKNQPEPQTAETDNSGYWIASGVVLGLTALVGVAAGSGDAGSSGGDDGSSGGDAGSNDSTTHNFKSPIRIGDDKDYNGNHKDDFKINTPSGTSYSESFQLAGNVSSGTLKYTIAGAVESAKIYMNSSLVGRTCNPGNTAYAIKECSPIDVTSNLKSGTNVLKVSCVLYPGDEVSPYDDIEIYNMRLITTH